LSAIGLHRVPGSLKSPEWLGICEPLTGCLKPVVTLSCTLVIAVVYRYRVGKSCGGGSLSKCKRDVAGQRRISQKQSGSRTCKPNSVCLAAGRSFLWARHYCRAQATYPEVVTRRASTFRAGFSAQPGIPPYLVLHRVGFALPASSLPRRCAFTAPFHPYSAVAGGAVCFLWHFPSSGF